MAKGIDEIEKVIDRLALKIDTSADIGDESELQKLDSHCLDLLKSSSGSHVPRIWYFRANIQAAYTQNSCPQSWEWRQPYREKEILYLRRAATHPDFESLELVVRAQILTNLANNLNHLGRSVEALQIYDQVISQKGNFAMALGNRGYARLEFAKNLHDTGHALKILLAARADLKAATAPTAFWESRYPGVRESFQDLINQIESRIDVDSAIHIKLKDYSLGRSKREQKYRSWALEHQLFVNPLNALGSDYTAATDHFGLPTHRVEIGSPPKFISWFNQLKQEFVAARILLFEAEFSPAICFADRSVMILDTLEHAAYGIALEKMRISFRTAYGLLDKIAGFLNSYFHIGDKPERVGLRNIWSGKEGTIKEEFSSRRNLPLRGLYWLSFDIIGNKSSDPDSIEPDAAKLLHIRNALEHRFISLREPWHSQDVNANETLTVDEFRAHTYKILKLARSSLIYLSLSIGQEERLRQAEENRSMAIPISLPKYRGRRPL